MQSNNIHQHVKPPSATVAVYFISIPGSTIRLYLWCGYTHRISMHTWRYTQIHFHLFPWYISVMNFLHACRCCIRYGRKLKSPLNPESTVVLATRVITQPRSDASLAVGVWFVAQQKGVIWEYWCRRGSLWLPLLTSSVDVMVPWGHICDWEWRWEHCQQQISWQGKESDLQDGTFSQRINLTWICIQVGILQDRLPRWGIRNKSIHLYGHTTVRHNNQQDYLPGKHMN